MLGRSSALVAAAVAGLAAMPGLPTISIASTDAPGMSAQSQKAIAKQGQNPMKEARDLRGLLGGGMGSPYQRQRRAAYGWTTAHAQRVAKKKRNQARHRRASKG